MEEQGKTGVARQTRPKRRIIGNCPRCGCDQMIDPDAEEARCDECGETMNVAELVNDEGYMFGRTITTQYKPFKDLPREVLKWMPKLHQQGASHLKELTMYLVIRIDETVYHVAEFDGVDVLFAAKVGPPPTNRVRWGYYSLEQLLGRSELANKEVTYDSEHDPAKAKDLPLLSNTAIPRNLRDT